MADRTGQQFGNYRLIPLAGRGRFILVSIFVSTHWLLSKQFARDEKLIRRDIKPENMLWVGAMKSCW
jgi:predicted transposase YbfD/YdcC